MDGECAEGDKFFEGGVDTMASAYGQKARDLSRPALKRMVRVPFFAEREATKRAEASD